MVCSVSINPEGVAKSDAQVSGTSQWANRLPWEDLLRESVFRSVSLTPLASNILYKRILTALFYHGPLAAETDSDGDSVALSRGRVYQLANGRWILCQDGCQECEPCTRATNPITRWIIRRIKRVSSDGVPRHDLQLTIIPQVSGSHERVNDWPTAYVYVATPGEMLAYSSDAYANAEDVGAFTGVGNNSSFQDEMTDGFTSEPIEEGNTSIDDPSTVAPTQNKERPRQFRKQRPSLRITEEPGLNSSRNGSSETKESPAQLILGTDHLGQKHLVHVVVAGDGSDYAGQDSLNTWRGLERTRLPNDSGKPDYQQLLRRIFHSLVSHRRSIERFLRSGRDGHPASIAADGAKDALELGHRMKGMNPAIGFYPSYDEVNNSQSAMATRRFAALRQSQESVALSSTAEMLNSIKNESQVLAT